MGILGGIRRTFLFLRKDKTDFILIPILKFIKFCNLDIIGRNGIDPGSQTLGSYIVRCKQQQDQAKDNEMPGGKFAFQGLDGTHSPLTDVTGRYSCRSGTARS